MGIRVRCQGVFPASGELACCCGENIPFVLGPFFQAVRQLKNRDALSGLP